MMMIIKSIHVYTSSTPVSPSENLTEFSSWPNLTIGC